MWAFLVSPSDSGALTDSHWPLVLGQAGGSPGRAHRVFWEGSPSISNRAGTSVLLTIPFRRDGQTVVPPSLHRIEARRGQAGACPRQPAFPTSEPV